MQARAGLPGPGGDVNTCPTPSTLVGSPSGVEASLDVYRPPPAADRVPCKFQCGAMVGTFSPFSMVCPNLLLCSRMWRVGGVFEQCRECGRGAFFVSRGLQWWAWGRQARMGGLSLVHLPEDSSHASTITQLGDTWLLQVHPLGMMDHVGVCPKVAKRCPYGCGAYIESNAAGLERWVGVGWCGLAWVGVGWCGLVVA